MTPTPALSIVMPAYNEARRLPSYLETMRTYCDSTLPGCYEVIVVDDGSQDGIWAWLQDAKATWLDLHSIRHDRNQRKGAAVRTRLDMATGEYILFTDADGTNPIGEEDALRCSLAAGRDMAIGIRSSKDDRVKRHVFRGIQNRLTFRKRCILTLPLILDRHIRELDISNSPSAPRCDSRCRFW